MTLQESYVEFVRHHCSDPDGGSPSSCKVALDKLSAALGRSRPAWAPDVDVWSLKSPQRIEELYKHVLKEQNRFIANESNIFEPYRGPGDSYFRKRWCSAALRYWSEYWNAQMDGNQNMLTDKGRYVIWRKFLE